MARPTPSSLATSATGLPSASIADATRSAPGFTSSDYRHLIIAAHSNLSAPLG